MSVTEKRTLFKAHPLIKEPCPFCYNLIWKGQNIRETPGWIAHVSCPVDEFLRRFKRVGLIKEEVKRIEFYKIPLYVSFLVKAYKIKIVFINFLVKEITQEEAKKIDEKMEALAWASRMFLEEGSGVVRIKNASSQDIRPLTLRTLESAG